MVTIGSIDKWEDALELSNKLFATLMRSPNTSPANYIPAITLK